MLAFLKRSQYLDKVSLIVVPDSRISASPNSDRATGVCFWITEIQGSYNIEKELIIDLKQGVVKRLDKEEQQTGRS
jgi:hypothetical protein